MNMFENMETLLELHKQGTMARVSTALRISQSTVSKRIAALEGHFGIKLVQKSGRKVTLTPQALVLVKRLNPLLVELRDVMAERMESPKRKLVLGVSESILSSWGL